MGEGGGGMVRDARYAAIDLEKAARRKGAICLGKGLY